MQVDFSRIYLLGAVEYVFVPEPRPDYRKVGERKPGKRLRVGKRVINTPVLRVFFTEIFTQQTDDFF